MDTLACSKHHVVPVLAFSIRPCMLCDEGEGVGSESVVLYIPTFSLTKQLCNRRIYCTLAGFRLSAGTGNVSTETWSHLMSWRW